MANSLATCLPPSRSHVPACASSCHKLRKARRGQVDEGERKPRQADGPNGKRHPTVVPEGVSCPNHHCGLAVFPLPTTKEWGEGTVRRSDGTLDMHCAPEAWHFSSCFCRARP